MSIFGSLEDVAVGDVLQFIHLGKRTGTLDLESEGRRARLGFHEGRLISARAPGAPRLGELLLQLGRVDAATLSQAMATQAATPGHPSLGQVLVDSGLLRTEALTEAMREQLERAVGIVVAWQHGSFDFALDEIRPVDDIGMQAGELLPEHAVDSNVVMLEAARIFDERDRRPPPAAGVEPALRDLLDETMGDAPPGGDSPEIRAVTPDRELAQQLRAALVPAARLRRVALGRAAEAAATAGGDLLLVDARAGALDPEALGIIRAFNPEARMVALVDSLEGLRAVYLHGALAAVPAEVETMRACLLSQLEAAQSRLAGEGTVAPPGDGMRRLQRVFGELRAGLASASITLNLMQLVSESFERAVLLLVARNRLVALGAFGAGADGLPLADAIRRLEVPLTGLLGRAVETGQLQSGRFADVDLPGELATELGEPRGEHAVVFPVSGTERVIAVVYADNGDSLRPVRDVELLELATAQAGIAFENELLRRQLGKSI